MTTFKKNSLQLNAEKINEIKASQKNKKSSSIFGNNSNLINLKRKSVFINNKKGAFFKNILSKQKDQYSSELENEFNKIILLLIKEPYLRTPEENKEIGDFLVKKYQFFEFLKNNDEEKYEVIISILHLKRFSANNIIINYENVLDKMFFLLEGRLIIYKPIFIHKLMTQEKFKTLLSILKNKENEGKYERTKEKNREMIYEFSYLERNKLKHFYVEENKKIGEIEEGQSFGGKFEDINEEKKNSDVIIKACEDSLIVFFSLDYYKKILDKIERKKFKEQIEKMRTNFILFQYFTDRRMIGIIKNFKSQTLYQDEYLYHQNEISDYIYFIMKGKFQKYVSFSFNWLLEYLDYIKDSTTNIIYHLVKIFPKNPTEHDDLLEALEEKKLKSPMVNEHLSKIEKIEEKNYEKYIYGIKSAEENINNEKNIFRIKLENIGIGEIPGLEDGLELKNRFYSVKCISQIAEVKKIKISDFLRIIKIYKSDNNEANNHILGLIAQKKFFLYQQVIKNAQSLQVKLTFNFDTKYDNLIEKNLNAKLNKEKDLSIAAIKAKGYKHEIREIFDKEIPIFPKIKKSLSDNYFLKNQNILKNLYKSAKDKKKGLVKFKNRNKNLTLSLSDPNYCSQNKNTRKYFFSEENLNSKINLKKSKYSFSSPKYINRSKFSITLSTNYSKFKSGKKIKKFKTEFFNKKLRENIKNKLNKIETEKNSNDKNLKLNLNCIESLLIEKFKNFNKKYYLGEQFKKKLDGEKKRFNLIHYKDFFNK